MQTVPLGASATEVSRARLADGAAITPKLVRMQISHPVQG